MSIVKEFQFPVSVTWQRGRLTRVLADEKPELRVVAPPVFKGGIDGLWSPEELLVASSASCYAITLAAIADRRGVAIRSLSVSGLGHVSRRHDGKVGFVAIELEARLVTDPDQVDAAEHVARVAEEGCLVSLALDVPVHLDVSVTAPDAVEPVAVA
jgi:organic hydroperoxide reductase OsmC/OhrA